MGDGHPWMTQALLLLLSLLNMVDPSPISTSEMEDYSPLSFPYHPVSGLHTPPSSQNRPPLPLTYPPFSSDKIDEDNLRFLLSLSQAYHQEGERAFQRKRRSGKCLFNSLAYNCDFQDAIGAANEASYWGSSSPGKSPSLENTSAFVKPSRTNKKNYLMRVGKRSGEADLARNARPDHGFLIRIGRSDKSQHFFHPTTLDRQILSNLQEPILTRNERADKGFLTRVGKADKSFLTRVGRSSALDSQPPANQDKRQKSGSKAYFLTRVGRAGEATKRKSYFTRVGRSSKSI